MWGSSDHPRRGTSSLRRDGGLCGIDVQARRQQRASLERVREGLLVKDGTACRVHQHRAGRQQGDPPAIDQPAGLLGERDVDAQLCRSRRASRPGSRSIRGRRSDDVCGAGSACRTPLRGACERLGDRAVADEPQPCAVDIAPELLLDETPALPGSGPQHGLGNGPISRLAAMISPNARSAVLCNQRLAGGEHRDRERSCAATMVDGVWIPPPQPRSPGGRACAPGRRGRQARGRVADQRLRLRVGAGVALDQLVPVERGEASGSSGVEMRIRAIASQPRLRSGLEPVRTAVKERHLAHVLLREQLHQQAG